MHRFFVSAAEAAHALGVSRETARHWAATGRIPATRTSAGWMLDADAVTKEAAMRQRIPAGFMSREEANTMLASFTPADRERFRGAIETLVWREPVPSCASRYDAEDAELDAEFAGMFRPKSPQEADARRRQAEQRISASRDDLDDDLAMFRALFGRDPA